MANRIHCMESLKGERGTDANLFIVKLKRLQGAVILAVEIIRAYRPKSSDSDVCGRLEIIIVIISIGGDSVNGVVIIVVLVTNSEAKVDPLEQALIHRKVDRRLSIIFSYQNSRIGGVPASGQAQ